jgi:glycosidase
MEDLIIYQIFPDRFANGDRGNDPAKTKKWNEKPTRTSFFGGDLQGIMNKIPYLKDLGINAIYLTPIFKSPSTHKYDAEDYFQIDPAFGTVETFEDLVKNAHKNNIKIILDGVFNHTGIKFFAFEDVRQNGKKSKYYDWYTIYKTPVKIKPKPTYEDAGIFYIPKLNYSNKKVLNYFEKVVSFWTDKGIDGWRFDMPWCIHEEIVNALIKTARDMNPDLIFIGESWEKPAFLLKKYDFDGTMDYTVRKSVIELLEKNLSPGEFKQSLDHKIENIPDKNWNMLGSHDTPRIYGKLHKNSKKLMIAQAIQFILPGDPVIYYGDEIGMTGGNDPQCRGTFDWDKTKWNLEIIQNIKNLIKIRKNNQKIFLRGQCEIIPGNRKMLIKRKYKNNSIVLIIDLEKYDYNLLVENTIHR